MSLGFFGIEVSMPAIVACPSCGGKLRVADELRGQRVRCPACRHIFESPAEPKTPDAMPRTPQDLPLDLSLGEPSPPPLTTLSDPGGLIGAIELKRSSDEPSPSSEPAPHPEPPRRPRLADTRPDRDIADLRRLGPRRDAEPDRGSAVLSLGIISLVGVMVWCIPFIGVFLVPICGILGLSAWIMGQIDLRKMKRGLMDDKNRGITQAGWICGILGTVLNGLITLGCGLLIGGLWYDSVSRLPNTKPIPVQRPAVPMAPKKMPRPPNNRPANPF